MISIIVPMYKGQHYIKRLISMVYRNCEILRPLNEKVELILINDFPLDKLILNKQELIDINVRVFENDRNIGIHATKVKGLSKALGDWILFLDQDDTITDNYLYSQLLKAGDNAAVFCNGIWREQELIFNDTYEVKCDFHKYLESGYPLVSLGQLLIKKDAIPQEWIKNTLDNNGWDDHYLWACLMYQSVQMIYNTEKLYKHEEDGYNESFNWSGMIDSGFDFKKKFLSTHNMNKDEKPQFEKLVNTKINKYKKFRWLEECWRNTKWEAVNELYPCQTNIAIYGLGFYGKKLLEKLHLAGINVVYGIDCNADNKHLDIPVYDEEQAKPSVDLIICATGFDDDNIKNKLKTRTITLEEFLDGLREDDRSVYRINGRPVIIWGAGRRTISALRINPDIKPRYIIDSDINKNGSIAGICIIHPNELNNWADFYFIINVKYQVDEIKSLLLRNGLTEKENFCCMEDFLDVNPCISDIQKLLMKICFHDNDEMEIQCQVNNRQEYMALRNKNAFLEYETYLGSYYNQREFRLGTYEGYCSLCKKKQNLRVSFEHSTRPTPYWRETLICPSCGMNSRMRFVLEYISGFTDKKIYVQERVTHFYENLEKIVPDLTGSEFLDPNLVSGEIVDGILHEDATALSFDDDMFDIIGSFDVFEHIDDYMKGLQEARRCLRTGGIFLFSVPLYKSRYNHIKRAGFSQNGVLDYYLEPEYHGNPLSGDGSLVFHEFGWKIIDDLKGAGFREVHAIVYASVTKGYFGKLPIIFEAIK